MTTYRLLTLVQQATTARQIAFSAEYEAFVADLTAKAFPNDPEIVQRAQDTAAAVGLINKTLDAAIQAAIDADVATINDDLDILETGLKLPIDKGDIVIPVKVAAEATVEIVDITTDVKP